MIQYGNNFFNFFIFNNPKFLSRIERLFDKEAADNIQKMTKIKLKRKILGD